MASPLTLTPEADANVRLACLGFAANAPTTKERVDDAQAMYDFVAGTVVTGSNAPLAPEA